MIDSKRLEVLKALTALLNTVTEDNGYQHDLSASVVRGVPVISANASLPLVSIIEFPQVEFTSQWVGNGRRYKHSLDLMIQGWTDVPDGEDGDMNPTDPCYRLLADVQKCLARIMDDGGSGNPGPDYMLGNRATRFDMTPGIVRPADENSSVPCFYLRVRIEVAETTSDPYDVS